ncbi:Transcriptional regulator, TetR family [Streptomyces sp. ADI96-02]|uniref:TetR/AcrR family transcriptional regulator n=1 Tax=unclassified Streptomyces TaxID=2593676 RepID=UPI000F557ABD|nr:TetR/AcrR family transcriptional regulator [Streptomyces sp. ADI96-02]RPK54850.1 Transcriptional regulator, TetR family [Streptomyces sp. ADI96-02]
MGGGTYHHGNLRAGLLARAEAVLEESGVDGLSLRSLARDLGVSHAAPARHFRDRQALLEALAAGGFTQLNERMRAAAEGGEPVRERIDALGRAYVHFAVEHMALLNLMFSVKHDAVPDAELRELGHQSLTIAAGLLTEAQRASVVRPGDPTMLAQVAFSTLHGLATLSVGSLLDDTPLADAVDLAIEVLMNGMGDNAAKDAATVS